MTEGITVASSSMVTWEPQAESQEPAPPSYLSRLLGCTLSSPAPSRHCTPAHRDWNPTCMGHRSSSTPLPLVSLPSALGPGQHRSSLRPQCLTLLFVLT